MTSNTCILSGISHATQYAWANSSIKHFRKIITNVLSTVFRIPQKRHSVVMQCSNIYWYDNPMLQQWTSTCITSAHFCTCQYTQQSISLHRSYKMTGVYYVHLHTKCLTIDKMHWAPFSVKLAVFQCQTLHAETLSDAPWAFTTVMVVIMPTSVLDLLTLLPWLSQMV
jgi:hypothetical protein